jgi:hypothetical protein
MSINFYKIGVTLHGAFFKQCPKFDVVPRETFDTTKGIVFNKGGNIKPRIMKRF